MLKKLDRVAIVLNYSNYIDTIKTVNKLTLYQSIDHVVIVDNCSPNESFPILKGYFDGKAYVIETPKNEGYATGNNFGIKYAMDKWGKEIIFFIVNPDVLVQDSVVNVVAEYIEKNKNNGLGQVAPKLSDGLKNGAWKFTSTGKTLILEGLFSPLLLPLKKKCLFYKVEEGISQRHVDVLSGAFFGIYGETFAKVNLFDEHTFLYGEEQILALKLKRLHFQNVQLQYIEYEHVGGSSTSETDHLFGFTQFSKSRRYMIKEYFNANKFELFLFDINYALAYFIRRSLKFFDAFLHKN